MEMHRYCLSVLLCGRSILGLWLVLADLHDRAVWAIRLARVTDLAPEPDEVQVVGVVVFGLEQLFQPDMCLLDAHLEGPQPDSPRDAVDVRVYGEGGPVERELQNDCSGLRADAVKFCEPE